MKNQKDIIERLADIQKTLLSQQPSVEQALMKKHSVLCYLK